MKGSITIGRDAGYQITFIITLAMLKTTREHNGAFIKLQKKIKKWESSDRSFKYIPFFVYEHISAIGCHSILLIVYLIAHRIP